MTASSILVWTFLPGDTAATPCGRFEHRASPAGQGLGTFVYRGEFLQSKFARALDPVQLPLQETLLVASAATAVFGVIADAGPEGWGRDVIDLLFGQQHSPIGYLLHSQEDRVGNLAFSRSTDAPEISAPIPRALLQDAWSVVHGLEAGRRVPPELEAKLRINTALGGARPKLTVADAQAQWLAKFPARRDDPRWSQARVEAAMLDLARTCKIDAAEAEVQEASHDGVAGDILLVKRFDRTLAPAAPRQAAQMWLRDAYVSARTVMEGSSHDAASSGGSYANFSRDLQRWSINSATDRIDLFRRMVFNCCISNTDDHDRNHGLLASEDGLGYRLAPAFDMVPRPHGTTRRYQAMNIGDHGAESTIDNLLSAAGAIDLDQYRASQIVDEVQTAVLEHWTRALEAGGLDEKAIELLAPCFQPLLNSFEAHERPARGWDDRLR